MTDWVKVECPLCGEMAVAETHSILKREWVGLIDEEHTSIQKQADYNPFMSASEFAARCQVLVEAKLKEKNT